MAERALVVGLTGSIGMGKTETARLFAQMGIPVHDADAAVHRLYASDAGAISAIAAAFPGCVQNGKVDRACLSESVHSSEGGLARLEEIIHPLVAAEQQAFIASASRDHADIVVLDIPLLFETGGEKCMDAVVVVSAPAESQRARVLARPGMNEDVLDHILARQLPDVDKRARAHFVVETDKGLSHARSQVEAIVAELRARRARGGNA